MSRPPASGLLAQAFVQAMNGARHASMPARGAVALSDPKLETRVQRLSDAIKSMQTSLEPDRRRQVLTDLTGLKQDLHTLASTHQQLDSKLETAVQDATRLKSENDALRKLSEDAVLDQQLKKALQETDKLKAAADAYKKDLLQQKLSDKEWELQQAREQMADVEKENSALTLKLQDLRSSRQDSAAQIEHLKRENERLKSLLQDSSDAPGQLQEPEKAAGSSEREALLARLQSAVVADGKGTAGDADLLAGAVKALQDATALEGQVSKLKQDNERLRAEITELNDTVFSKNFKAPSAWAEREIKYKMEKKQWEQQLAKLRKTVETVRAENVQYRASNKTEEFEQRIAAMQKQIEKTEGEKVSAQKELHELHLDMQVQQERYRQLQEARRHTVSSSAEDGIRSIVSELDRAGLGPAQPTHPHKPPPQRSPSKGVTTPRGSSWGSGDGTPVAEHAMEAGNVEEIIMDLDDQGIGRVEAQAPGTGPKQHRRPPTAGATSVEASAVDSRTPAGAADAAQATTSGHAQEVAHGLQAQQQQQQPSHQPRPRQADSSAAAELPAGNTQQLVEGHQAQGQGGGQTLGPPGSGGRGEAAAAAGRGRVRSPPALQGAEPSGGTQGSDETGGTRRLSGSPTAASSSSPRQGWQSHVLADGQAAASSSRAIGAQAQAEQGVGRAVAEPTPGRLAQVPEEAAATPAGGQGGSSGAALASAWQGPAFAAAPGPSGHHASDAAAAAQHMGKSPPAAEAGAVPGSSSFPGTRNSAAGVDAGQDEASGAESGNSSQATVPGGRSPALHDPFLTSPTQPVTPTSPPSLSPHEVQHGDSGHLLSSMSSLECAAHNEACSSNMDNPLLADAVHAAEAQEAAEALQVPADFRAHSAADGRHSRETSETDDAWTEERLKALEEDRVAVERMWGEHAQETDIGVLKFKIAEFDSRCEMYEAQIQKGQRALERADQEKARLEDQLLQVQQALETGDPQAVMALRDQLEDVVSSKREQEGELQARLQEAEQVLEEAHRERSRLEKHRSHLESELSRLSAELGMDLKLTPIEEGSEDEPEAATPHPGVRALQKVATAGASPEGRSSSMPVGASRRKMGGVIPGFSEAEVEMMRLREENEALMDSLVRTKVELADTQGDYLKTKRAMIRAVEKQALLSEKIDLLKEALAEGGVTSVAGEGAQPKPAPSPGKAAPPAPPLPPAAPSRAFSLQRLGWFSQPAAQPAAS